MKLEPKTLRLTPMCRRRALMLVTAATGAALAGCTANLFSDNTPLEQPTAAVPLRPSTPSSPVRIGMVLPLSGLGPDAQLGKGLKQAGEMALFELDNPLVQIIVKNDKGTPEGAAAAASEAIAEGAEIIVGPISAAATAAVAPVAKKANVPVLSFSNDRRMAGNGVYLLSTLPEQEVDRIISYTVSQGRRSIAALVPNSDSAQIFETALRTSIEKQKASLASLTRYPTEPNAMLLPVRDFFENLKQAGGSTPGQQQAFAVDAVFIVGSPEALTQMSTVVSYSGAPAVGVKMIGTSAWDYPNAGRNTALVGGWYAGPEPRGWQDFTQRFTRSFGQAPPRLSSLSYEAVSLAISLSGFEAGKRYTVETLTRSQGFQGVDGPFRLKADGTAERSLSIIEMQSFGGNVINGPFGAGAQPPGPAPASVLSATPPTARAVSAPGAASAGTIGAPAPGPIVNPAIPD